MPRYEYSSGSSNKFWEITVDGDSYTVQYGRIGTVGQTRTKAFKDAAACQKKAEAAIKSKVKKGYQLVDAEELAEAKAVEDERMVKADELQEAGDPRGELIPIQKQMTEVSGNERAALRKEEVKILEEHADALLGPIAEGGAAACAQVEWSLGYWDRLALRSSYNHQEVALGDLLKKALAHDSAAHLTDLKLGIPENVWDGMSNWQPMIDALCEVGAPEVTALELADHDDNAEISWCEIGNLSGVWAVCPKLESLYIRGVGVSLGDIEAPNLKVLTIISGGLPGSAVRSISKAKLPACTKLDIYLGTEDYGASSTLEDCQGILDGRGLPVIEHLGLKNGQIMNDLASAMHHAAVLPRLKTLDLSMGTMTDEGARHIVDNTDAYTHLSRLDLSENFLSDGMCSQLRKALPNAALHSQKDAYEYDEEPWYYTSIAE